jgi:hypothetical protein
MHEWAGWFSLSKGMIGVIKLVKAVTASLIQKKPNFLQSGQAKGGIQPLE